jgi:protein-disulfide isomerase/uncharacterized membrane protein
MRELSPRHAWRICAFLAGIGIAGTAYLTGRVLDLAASRDPGALDLCSALFASSCDGALGDERFWILGVPLAGWGLVYFTALGGLLFLARFTRGAFEAEALLAGTLVTLFGVAVGIALSAWMLFGHAPVCPLCLAVHAISVLLLLALRRASPRPFAAQLQQVRSASRWLVGSGAETPEPVRWKLVGFASVALLAALAYQWVYVESALRRPPHAPDRAAIIAGYRGTPWNDLPVSEGDPHLGPLTAPVRLVVFESFRCPGCRRLAGTLSRLRDTFRDRLVIVYKHYPLSTQCNGRLTQDMQPGACELAWAAEAARRQARFWPFHDAIFAARGHPSQSDIAETVRRLRLDPARFDADRKSDSTLARVAADIALGDRLKIPGTPAVFLDGRLVSSAGAGILETLIRYELGPHHGMAATESGRHGSGPARDY